MMARAIAVAFVVMLAPAGAAAEVLQGVVRVVSDVHGHKEQGTGFLVSKSGEILTCYHVIYEARDINVFWPGGERHHVVVSRVGPTVDLAVIRIDNVPPDMKPLPLADQIQLVPGAPIYTVGHPRGMDQHRFDGWISKNNWDHTEAMHDDHDNPLFTIKGVDLVPTSLTIEHGLSGAPILRQGRVIGVISGSLATGHGMAWGIPVTYEKDEKVMQSIEQPAGAIAAWPKWVMTRAWVNLRSQFRIGDPERVLLDEYFDALERRKRADDEYLGAALIARDQLANLRRSLAALPERGVAPELVVACAQRGSRIVAPLLQPAEKAAQAEAQLMNAGDRLVLRARTRNDGLPRTELNLQNEHELQARMAKVRQALPSLNVEGAPSRVAMQQAQQLIAEANAAVQADDPDRALLALRRLVDAVEEALQSYTGEREGRQRSAYVAGMQDIGAAFQTTFMSEQDLASQPTRYRSAKGYSFVMPAGWVPITPRLQGLMSVQRSPEIDQELVRSGYFGDGLRGFDRLAADVFPAGEQRLDRMSDAKLEAWRAQFVAQTSEPGALVAASAVQRTTFGPYKGVWLEVRYQPGQRVRRLEYAFVAGARPIVLLCLSHSETTESACKVAASSLEFGGQ